MTELKQFKMMLVRAKIEYEKYVDTVRVDYKPFEASFYVPNSIVVVFSVSTGELIRFENLD